VTFDDHCTIYNHSFIIVLVTIAQLFINPLINDPEDQFHIIRVWPNVRYVVF